MGAEDLRNLSDAELLHAYSQCRDGNYFQEVFRRYSGKIRSGCVQFFKGDSAMGEDAAQETFRKALEKIDSCASENVGGWLYMIAKHCCIDLHRKQWPSLPNSEVSNPARSWNVGGITLVEQEKEIHMEELRQRINQLNEKQRISLKLYLEGYSYKEISKITPYNEKEVKSAIQASKENLRKWYLEREGRK